MRILIKFKNDKKINYQQNQLGGLIYKLIKNAGYGYIHDFPQKFPRFFSFSSLFLSNNHLAIIIASPIDDLIKSIRTFLIKNKVLILNKTPLLVSDIKTIKYKLKHPIIIKTETPIIVRVPQEKFTLYGIKLDKNYKYFYWRPLENKHIPLEPFIKQLESRVYKNYKLFTNDEKIEEIPIFIKFKYKKTIDLPYFKEGKKISQPGTLWEFEINPEVEYNLIKFILDTGLGELTSQGYGFISLKNER
ncbi:MAG: CRISPR-associated endoribonuclease Cas6 [Minisyncoccia bacterium]|jgi:CRISPR-associated endoribonuclease Cas6